jgi:hypothetical protein
MTEKTMEFHVLKEPKKTVAYVCKFPDPDGVWVVSWNSSPAGTEIWGSKEKLMKVHGHGGRELVPMQKFDLGSPE